MGTAALRMGEKTELFRQRHSLFGVLGDKFIQKCQRTKYFLTPRLEKLKEKGAMVKKYNLLDLRLMYWKNWHMELSGNKRIRILSLLRELF